MTADRDLQQEPAAARLDDGDLEDVTGAGGDAGGSVTDWYDPPQTQVMGG